MSLISAVQTCVTDSAELTELARSLTPRVQSGKMEKMGKGDRDKYVTMIELLLVHETAAAMAAKHARPGSDHDGVGEVEVEPSSAGTNDEL